jgi:hypothetical protein
MDDMGDMRGIVSGYPILNQTQFTLYIDYLKEGWILLYKVNRTTVGPSSPFNKCQFRKTE